MDVAFIIVWYALLGKRLSLPIWKQHPEEAIILRRDANLD